MIIADRVRETSLSIGLGAITLDGAVSNFVSFLNGIGNGNSCYYTIVNQDVAEWEVGIGTVGAGTLSRDTVLASSNSNNFVPFSVGNKDVFNTIPAFALNFQNWDSAYGWGNHTLTSDEKDAIHGANSPNAGNVYATMTDLTGGLTSSQSLAIKEFI